MSTFPVELAPDNIRVDPDTGVTEIVEFFGDGPDRIFGTRHIPAGPVIGGLLICSSIHAELLNSYRMEIKLARNVAARGIAVQRFHYRGHGNSGEDVEGVTYDGMVRDAVTAAEHLREGGPAITSFLGTRWGALIAGSAAARFDGATLALWEPVVSAQQFFREAFRQRLIGDYVREGRVEGAPPDDVATEMQNRGFVEVMGYTINAALQATSEGRTLAGELGGAPRRVFIGQIGITNEPRVAYRKLMDAWQEAGFEVHVEIHRQEEISWFLPNARRTQETRQPLIEATADWLVEAHRQMAGLSAVAPSKGERNGR